jgi:hypothetical protein
MSDINLIFEIQECIDLIHQMNDFEKLCDFLQQKFKFKIFELINIHEQL